MRLVSAVEVERQLVVCRCTSCPLRASCTTSATGRTVTIHAREDLLQAHKAQQRDPDWQEAYTGTRPKVERKIAHFVRRPWGGRKARVRGQARIATDADTRAAALNWSRLATLGVNLLRRGVDHRPTVRTIDLPLLHSSPPLRDSRTPENPRNTPGDPGSGECEGRIGSQGTSRRPLSACSTPSGGSTGRWTTSTSGVS